jgi:hypothetical protein
MGRKKVIYKVESKDRDSGKTFVLTEMPVRQAENWAMRALFALISSDVDLPENLQSLGMAGIAEIGFKALSKIKDFTIVDGLLSEMLDCVEFMPDASKSNIVRPLFDGDVEEISTLIKLRFEAWKLHVDFSMAEITSIFGQ